VLLIIGGPGGIPGTAAQTNPLFPWVYLAMLVGPSVAGICMTALVHRTAGLRQFRSRVLNWRIEARWYAIALLTAPVLVTATLLAMSLTSADYLPGVILGPVAVTGRALVAYEVALGAMLWVVVGVIGAADYARRAGRPLRRRAA
jgi:hypothetical protein